MLGSSAAFVAGFTVVFTALGASSTLVGSALLRHLPVILDVSGVFMIAFGLASTGLVRVGFLARERRFDLARVPKGPKGAFPLGMAFAFGWTPCVGPVLATVLAVASTGPTVAVGFTRARTSLGWLRRRGRVIELAGGVLLVAVGVLFLTGEWKQLFIPLQDRFARLGWPPL